MEVEKAKMMSLDMTQENIRKIQALFPNVVVEAKDENGYLKLAVDFNALKQELSDSLIEDKQERYQITWPDKKQSVILANKSVVGTLRPQLDKSVDFDKTENIYIEGDNLDVLKLLRETYLGKVKMIYIDPPYNTGNDFIYNDDFSQAQKDYLDNSGIYDSLGNKLVTNSESNGRFHTDWLNSIYSRLKVAKDLLIDDGVIFISIDDNEVHNLRRVCDEIFGERCFVAQAVRKRRDSQANLSKNISPIHEYVLIYSRTDSEVLNKVSANIDETAYKNPDNDPRGPYVTMPCTNKGGAVYSVVTPTGKTITEEWRFKQETYQSLFNDNRIVFPKGGDGKPRYKIFLSEKRAEGQLANTWWDFLASNQEATREIKELFDGSLVFDTPKPTELIQFCIELSTKKDSIIVDFYSGSAATANAVLKMNLKDGGHRKYILVQLPEECGEKTEAFKAGYRNICDIGEERIRRAGKKIKTEAGLLANDLDIGFRVFKLDSSNMNEVYYNPKAITQNLLEATVDNIKPDRTPLDLLFQVMLECGALLSSKIEEKEINGKKVYIVEDNYIAACFDDEVDDKTVEAIAKLKPIYACFKGSSFNSDSANINAEQIFKTYSPNTEKIKVI